MAYVSQDQKKKRNVFQTDCPINQLPGLIAVSRGEVKE